MFARVISIVLMPALWFGWQVMCYDAISVFPSAAKLSLMFSRMLREQVTTWLGFFIFFLLQSWVAIYMLVPLDMSWQQLYDSDGYWTPDAIPEYGGRGWCRGEFWTFGLWSDMAGQKEVQLWAVTNDGKMKQYETVEVYGDKAMPSGGELTNEADRALIKREVEEPLIGPYGNTPSGRSAPHPRVARSG